jgi:hypothetical protein
MARRTWSGGSTSRSGAPMSKRILLASVLLISAIGASAQTRLNGPTAVVNGAPGQPAQYCFEPTYGAGPDACIQRTGPGIISVTPGTGTGIPIGSGAGATPVNLVLAGDSQTRGGTAGSTPLSTPISTYNPLLFVTNKGIDGDTVATMITEGPTVIDTLFVPGATNILHMWAGTNDMCSAGATPAATFANLQTYVNARKAVGWKVVIGTMLSRTGTNPIGGETCDADAVTYNALIRASSFASAVNDFGANLEIGPSGKFSNATFFVADGIHPNSLTVNNILGPTVYSSVMTLTGIATKAAIAVAHTASGGGAGSASTIVSGPMAVTTGNFIACHTRNASASPITSVGDTAGNFYTSLPVSAASATNFQWWYAKNIIGHPTDAVTATLSTGSVFTGIHCWELVGIDRQNPVEYEQAFVAGASSGTATTTPFPTLLSNDIVLVTDDSNAVNSTFTPGAGYTVDSAGFPSGAGNLFTGAEHQVFVTTQTGATASMNHSPNATSQIHSAVFRGDFGTESLTSRSLTNPTVNALFTSGTPNLSGTGACATITTVTGGAWAAQLTCTGTTGASTLVITPGVPARGWACFASDQTTAANILRQSANSATTCTISGTVNANDVLTFGAFAF